MALEGTLIGVVGAGAMGAGIAEVAATAGHKVILFDARVEQVAKARAGIDKNLARGVEKGRLTATQSAAIFSRIEFKDTQLPATLGQAGLIVEAIVEDLAAKQELFRALENVTSLDTIIATNTSSLSIAALASVVQTPRRIVGLHFFNPVPLMALVEVIPGIATDPAIVPTLSALMAAWGKIPVTAKDTPGFIVNRVARPFYSEALRILDEGIADCATIDYALKTLAGFKMGPFELMDFIGNDINFKVTKTVFEATFFNPRYRPSLTQQRLVEAGYLGKKSGQGFYSHSAPMPAPKADPALAEQIMRRVVVMLMNEAAFALQYGIASAEAIDTAMQKGVNYPRGLLAWADEWGHATVEEELLKLHNRYREERYAPCSLWANHGRFSGV